MAGKLEGKVAVITGGGSGIGLASARLFLEEGARVAITGRSRTTLESAAAELNAGDRLILLSGDAGDEDAVATQAAEVERAFGGFDVLLASAGWSTGTNVPDTSLEQWNAVLNTNLTGSFLWAREAVASMRRRGGGSIIFVGSQLAYVGGKSNAAYLATKGALDSLCRTMAVDHAPENIRVNLLVPGAIDTPLLRRAFARNPDPAAAEQKSIARHPLGRLGLPEEQAKAVLFLASDDSSFTTGSRLVADGGWMAG
ncbi:MAG: SDR family oxidoreductase [Rhizobiaceae bacterium]|nr:SDR family oxidoreductase [Rhizobiaceae bacterium]